MLKGEVAEVRGDNGKSVDEGGVGRRGGGREEREGGEGVSGGCEDTVEKGGRVGTVVEREGTEVEREGEGAEDGGFVGKGSHEEEGLEACSGKCTSVMQKETEKRTRGK